jgi:deazaflavin-dependent oxidoreductase (nitroreductase family)
MSVGDSMSIPSRRTRRIVWRVMRLPAGLDRRGLRWMLRVWPGPPIVILVYRGRRSGRTHRTPVEAIAVDGATREIVVSPMWGERSDWYRNVIAGGLIEVRFGGETLRVQWRRLSEPEAREMIERYLREYRLYARMVGRTLMRLHGLSGDPREALPRALPVLTLTRAD